MRSTIFFTMLFHASSIAAADWPQFRGPNGSGASAETGLPVKWSDGEGLAWKTNLPGPGTSSPIAIGERIYLTCYTGYNVPGDDKGDPEDLKRHLVCLNRKSGEILWNTPTKAKLPEQANIRDGHGYATNTPAADADRIYCFYGRSGAFAFDHDGKQLWQADVGDGLNGWGSAASPVLFGDLVIVNASVESDTLLAFDKKTGKEKWKADGIKDSWSTPVVAKSKEGRDELLVPIKGKILAFDPATGERLWTCDTDITWYMVPTIVVNDGVAYSLGGRSGVVGLAVKLGGSGDVTESHRLWTIRKATNVSSPVLHGSHLYWMNDNRETAYCAEAETGKIVYEERVPRSGQIYASALLADGKVYYLSRDGKIVVVAAKPEFEILATNNLRDGSLFHASPVALDGRLLVRSDLYLYCVGNK
jgi:outer membrane protein assembly factor BamB